MASGAGHTTYLVAEVTRGTTPATPAWSEIKCRTNSVKLTRDAIAIEEPTADRQTREHRLGAYKVAGEITIFLRYGNYDTILEALLGGTWAPKATKTATTISAAASDNSVNDSADGFLTAGFAVGDVVGITGFTGDIANNKARRTITAVTAGKMTFGGTDGDDIADDAAGESVTLTTVKQRLKTGTTRRSFSMLRKYAEITDKPYHIFSGLEANSLALSIKANAAVEATIGFVGYDGVAQAADVAGATYPAVTLNAVLDPTTTPFKEGGASNATITEMSVNLGNGIDPLFVLGSKKSILPDEGMSEIDGSMSAYYRSNALLDKFLAETETSCEQQMPDAAGNLLTVIVPRMKYTAADADVKGAGSIMSALPFKALYDTTTATTLLIERTPVA